MADTEVAPKNRITPEVVGVMKHLETRAGRLSPTDVLAEAAATDSPLHEFFEWNDTVAGEMYRLDQARTLIRRVKFEVIVDEVTVRSVRYISEPNDDKSMYIAQPKIRSREHASSVMAAELARLLGNVDRTLGIARIQAAILPDGIAGTLEAVRHVVADMLDECRG
jgi:hypothetical protein